MRPPCAVRICSRPSSKRGYRTSAFEIASLGVQVHGGTGYIDDAEISQVFRDARIGSIFEGTNYIQAQDLLGRKIVRDHGAALAELLDDIESTARALPSGASLEGLRSALLESCAELRATAARIVAASPADPQLIGTVAYEFLSWLGVLAGGWQWALSAAEALERSGSAEAQGIIATASFYAARILPRTRTYAAAIAHGSQPVEAVPTSEL